MIPPRPQGGRDRPPPSPRAAVCPPAPPNCRTRPRRAGAERAPSRGLPPRVACPWSPPPADDHHFGGGSVTRRRRRVRALADAARASGGRPTARQRRRGAARPPPPAPGAVTAQGGVAPACTWPTAVGDCGGGAIRGSAAIAAAMNAAAASIIAAATLPRPSTDSKLSRPAQRPVTLDVLELVVLGVQHGVLADQ